MHTVLFYISVVYLTAVFFDKLGDRQWRKAMEKGNKR